MLANRDNCHGTKVDHVHKTIMRNVFREGGKIEHRKNNCEKYYNSILDCII